MQLLLKSSLLTRECLGPAHELAVIARQLTVQPEPCAILGEARPASGRLAGVAQKRGHEGEVEAPSRRAVR